MNTFSDHNGHYGKRRTRHAQSGAALVVGLLLLLVLTLLAISGMGTSTLELAMAGNIQFREDAFQAAETGIEHGLKDGIFNPDAPPETFEPTTLPGSADTYTVTITPQLNGKALDAMWGSTVDKFSTYHFEISSNGSSARNAEASNVQGVATIAPKSPVLPPLDPSAPELEMSPSETP